MARKYLLGDKLEYMKTLSELPPIVENEVEQKPFDAVALDDARIAKSKGMDSSKAGALAGGLQAASSMFGQFNNIFNNKNSNEYMTYDDSWAGIVSNSNRRRQGVDAVNAQLQDYSGMNSINDFFAAFGGYQPKSFAVGGHISGVKPLDDNNVAGSVGTAIATDATKGAAIGTQIMPGWGTLIGAAVGTVAGATRGGIGAAQAKKNVGYLNNAIDKVNYMNDINRDNQISTIMNRNIRSTFPYGGNLFQYGGEIDPAMLQQLMAQQGQPQDFGDTGNGVTTFDEGGTHEMNPNGGIPQGVAPDGEENLVEEGEVKYKDYIYSDRLIATKQLLKEHNLPTKYAGKSFANIADKLQEESKDRPNDEISKSTLDDMMSRLEEAQEEYKAQKEIEDKASQIDNMAPEEKAALLDQIQMMGQQQPAYGMQQPQGLDPMMAQQMMQPQDASMQQPQMSPEEQAMLEQQMAAEQGGQPYACGGRKKQYGGSLRDFQDNSQQQLFDNLRNTNLEAYLGPIGTRFAGQYAYAPFYDQYEALLASQPVVQPQSIGYTYQPSATELELNAIANSIKEDQAKQDFYNRWVGTGKNKKGNYWYYTNDPKTKHYTEKPSLAEVDATVADMGYADTYAEGGEIYIKPSKRGTFTAAAKKHGKSVQAFASQVLANKENYSPTMVKKANFARNASKWHQWGGPNYTVYSDLYGNLEGLETEPVDNINLQLWQNYPQVEDSPFRNQKFRLPFKERIKVIPDFFNSLANKSKDKQIVEEVKEQPTKAKTNESVDYTQPTKQMLFDEAYNRYGTYLSPLISMLQPKDYELPNRLTELSGQITPHTVPNIRYEGRYEPMDVNNYANLIAAQNAAAQLASQQGGTRATTAAQRIALQNAYIAQQNDLATKVAEANYNRRKAIADEAVRVAQANANINEANAKLLTDADNRRLALLEAAAQARDASNTAWAQSVSNAFTNQISEAGRMKQQDFNNQMMLEYIRQHALSEDLKRKVEGKI